MDDESGFFLFASGIVVAYDDNNDGQRYDNNRHGRMMRAETYFRRHGSEMQQSTRHQL